MHKIGYSIICSDFGKCDPLNFQHPLILQGLYASKYLVSIHKGNQELISCEEGIINYFYDFAVSEMVYKYIYKINSGNCQYIKLTSEFASGIKLL